MEKKPYNYPSDGTFKNPGGSLVRTYKIKIIILLFMIIAYNPLTIAMKKKLICLKLVVMKVIQVFSF